MTITIDGSFGEGGGQILRSSLALSIVTGKPFRIDNIRAKRKKPGLMRQHRTAVRAAAEICAAKVTGDAIGSARLDFSPGPVRGGEYTFSIGTAGSTTLVLQTILLPLTLAKEPSRITLEGGTHNPNCPPFDFLAKAYLPLVNRMGPAVNATLERSGFYPAGGGCFAVDIGPVAALQGFNLTERGLLQQRRATATVANLARHIAEREASVICRKLGWEESEVSVVESRGVPGPGNIVTIALEHENVTEVFTGFGEIGRSAESVATHAVQQCQRYLKSTAPAGEHLTDQLILPMAIAGSGGFESIGLSPHAETHIELIRYFLDQRISAQKTPHGTVRIDFR